MSDSVIKRILLSYTYIAIWIFLSFTIIVYNKYILDKKIGLYQNQKDLASAYKSEKMVKGRQGERVRLYMRGTILGYKRSKSNQYPNTSLIQIEGVNTKEEVAWYAGKRMAYIYKAKVLKAKEEQRKTAQADEEDGRQYAIPSCLLCMDEP